MRILTISSAIILSLLLSHTSVQAQDKLDEFESFRAKLNKSNKAGVAVSPDDEENADTSPLAVNSTPTREEQATSQDATELINKAIAYRSAGETVQAYASFTLAYRLLTERLKSGHGTAEDETLMAHTLKAITALNLNMDTGRRQEALRIVNSDPPKSALEASEFVGKIMADSKITAVTVYSNRAKITRVAEVDIPAGAQTVVFKDMPSLLLADSIRADGSSKAAVKFGALSSKKVMLSKPAHPRERELRDNIEKLRDQIKLIEMDNAGIASRKQFIEDAKKAFMDGLVQNASHGKEAPVVSEVTPEQWVAAAETFEKGIADIGKVGLENLRKTREINTEISRIEREIAQSSTGETSTFAVMVPVESNKASKLKIELSYQIPNATWKPIYDARLSTETGKLELTQYGEVHQVTGEDWKDVELTLSTAQPQRGAQTTALQPWWINSFERGMRGTPGNEGLDEEYKTAIERENERAAKQAAMRGGSAMPIPIGKPQDDVFGQESGDPLQEWRAKAEARRLVIEPEQKVVFRAATLETGGFMSEYKIVGESIVPSDGTQTKLLIGTFDADSKMNIHIKPQLSNEAFLIAHAKLKGESPILPGQVNLFRDGAFSGQSRLPLLRPGEEHEISFGIDDQVSVKRKTLKDESKEEGLINRDRILEREYVTEIQNLHSTPVTIVVKETMPVPRNEQIKVDLKKEFTEPGYKSDVENIKGQLAWEFTLQPKDKKELKLGWTVNWPKDHTLSGL